MPRKASEWVYLLALETSLLLFLNNISPESVRYVSLISDSVYALAGLSVLLRMMKGKIKGGAWAALILLFVYTANSAIKVSVGEPRPQFSVAGLNPFDTEATQSFPSTHSAIAFAAAGLAGNPVLYIWAALIAISRVALGAHYPHDVIAGAILGYVLSKALSSKKLNLLFSRENIFETRRQVFHAFFGAAIAFIIYFLPKESYVALIALAAGMAFAFSGILKKTGSIPGLSWLVDKFERKKDIKNMPLRGTIFFMLGALVSALVFEKSVAFASVLILAAGDGATTLIGRPLGRHKHFHNKKKSLEGTLAGIFASYVAAAFFVPLNAAIMGAVIFGVVESFDFQKNTWLDDNFVVPLAVGIVMSVV